MNKLSYANEGSIFLFVLLFVCSVPYVYKFIVIDLGEGCYGDILSKTNDGIRLCLFCCCVSILILIFDVGINKMYFIVTTPFFIRCVNTILQTLLVWQNNKHNISTKKCVKWVCSKTLCFSIVTCF